eukprot:evm.model.NODE_29353_length_14271_cov_25.066639.2
MALSPRRSGRRALPPARFVNHDDKDQANLNPNNSARDGKPPPLPLSTLLGSKGVVFTHLPTPHSIEKQASTVSSCTTAEAFSSSSSSCDSETEGEEDDDEVEEEETKKEEESKKREDTTKEDVMAEKKQLDLNLSPHVKGAAGGACTLGQATTTPPCPPGLDEANVVSSLFIAARTGDSATLHHLLHSSSSPLSSLPSAVSSILDTPHPSTGETALEVAAEEGHASIVTLLLQGGADPMKKNKQTGGTPMGKAFSGLHLECYRLLEVREGGKEGGKKGGK